MKKFVYLSTCDTCRRILSELDGLPGFERQDIKVDPLDEVQVDQLKEMAGSYEALFSKRARKYRQLGLHEKELGETDFRKYLLQDYTFFKRPVVISGSDIFIGNSKKTVAEARKKIFG